MAITIRDRTWRTLDDLLYVNGKLIKSAYVNGVLVYPDDIVDGSFVSWRGNARVNARLWAGDVRTAGDYRNVPISSEFQCDIEWACALLFDSSVRIAGASADDGPFFLITNGGETAGYGRELPGGIFARNPAYWNSYGIDGLVKSLGLAVRFSFGTPELLETVPYSSAYPTIANGWSFDVEYGEDTAKTISASLKAMSDTFLIEGFDSHQLVNYKVSKGIDKNNVHVGTLTYWFPMDAGITSSPYEYVPIESVPISCEVKSSGITLKPRDPNGGSYGLGSQYETTSASSLYVASSNVGDFAFRSGYRPAMRMPFNGVAESNFRSEHASTRPYIMNVSNGVDITGDKLTPTL